MGALLTIPSHGLVTDDESLGLVGSAEAGIHPQTTGLPGVVSESHTAAQDTL